MRHAKSDWGNPGLPDHDRPLNERGIRDAPRMASWLNDQGLRPNFVLCSSAKRTCQTSTLMMSVWDHQPQVKTTDELYLATSEDVLATVARDTADHKEVPSVMVLAHNPGISHAASILCGESIGLVTAALVVLELEISSWGDLIDRSVVTNVITMKPKSL